MINSTTLWQNSQDEKVYVKKPTTRQGNNKVTCSLNSDDMPYVQTGFCHYLRIKNFETRNLCPGEKITGKQKKAMESIVANCLKLPGHNISIGFHKSFFGKGSPPAMSGYGFKPFDTVRRLFENAGYIETYAPRSYNTDQHPVSWMRGTKKLYDTISSGAVIEYKPDFVYLLKGKVKESDKQRRYLPLKNPNHPLLIKVREIMDAYHRQLECHNITCPVPDHVVKQVYAKHAKKEKRREYRHRKNKKNKKAFRPSRPPAQPDVSFKYPIVIFSDNLESNGRLYNSWWTGCKREYRQYLRIDGEQCAELDFKSMHPNILYQMENLSPQDNIYLYGKDVIFQDNIRTRDVVKVLFLSLINIDFKRTIKETRSHTIQAARQEIKSKYGVTVDYGAVSDLLSEIEARHFPIVKHFYNAAWRYCTAYESNLIRDIIKAAIAKNILVLSVHDSIVCRVSDMEAVRAIIEAKTRLPFDVKLFN